MNIKIVTFKRFVKDYREYYSETNKRFNIRTEEDMEEVIYDLYSVESYEVDYENKVIELY